eukprot:8298558-Prorocentrum_lima.AAC.1
MPAPCLLAAMNRFPHLGSPAAVGAVAAAATAPAHADLFFSSLLLFLPPSHLTARARRDLC